MKSILKYVLSASLSGMLHFSTLGAEKISSPGAQITKVLADKASINQPAAEKASFFVTDGDSTPEDAASVKDISLLKSQKAFLKLKDVLLPGEKYTVTFFLRDSEGKDVPIQNPKIDFVPDEPSWNLWSEPYTPDYKTQKLGKWIWTAEVTKIGRFKAEVNVLPLTPDENKNLAQHEKANQSMARAFASYWRADGEHFFTKIIRADEKVEVERKIKPRRVHIGPGSDPLLDGRSEGPSREEYFVTNTTLKTNISFIQVSRIGYNTYAAPISDADTLNGITYRGGMSVGFRLFRTFEPQVGWREWEDTSRLVNSSALFSPIASLLGSMAPQELKNTLNLSFTAIQRDGNWFVDTSRGDHFVNGKLVSKAETKHSLNDPNFFSPPYPPPDKFTLSEQSEVWTTAPSPHEISEALAGRTPTRDAAQAEGQSAREAPEALERGVITTMQSLLGKPLAR